MIKWILKRLRYKANLKDTLHLYGILIMELIFFPFLILFEEILKLLSQIKTREKYCERGQIDSNEILVCVHEWAGYESVRKKKIRDDIIEFECGLHYQLERFTKYTGDYLVDLTLTISDRTKFSYILPPNLKFIDVPNQGSDFSGYSAFYDKKIKHSTQNQYVILTNSSVEKSIQPFIDEYIKIFEQNRDMGILGISYCTKMYQSFIINNFNPHIGTFFLLTTTEILKKVVKQNRNIFPGKGITHKLLLIRKGEIKLSKLVLDLNYKIGIVLQTGIYTFGNKANLGNGYHSWPLPLNDYRLYTLTPNKINLPK